MQRGAGVLCCGNLVYDTLVKPVDELKWDGTTFVESIECHAGGNATNTSRALAILGTPARILGAVGWDRPGQFLIDTLQAAGVDTTYLERLNAPTSSTVAMVKTSGERKFFHCLGAGRDAFSRPISFSAALCARMTHFHLASMLVLPRLRAYGPEMLLRARQAGMTTSFDTNWDLENGWMNTLRPCLPLIDVLFMNEEEAWMITHSRHPREIAEAVLKHGLRVLALKLGKRGCAIYYEAREVLCPAFDVPVHDTTGAGDSFVGGFLTAYLDGASLEDAGTFANAVAAMSVQRLGAVNGVVSKEQTYAWMVDTRTRSA